jgi:UDP-glucuronate decarboxylase
MDKNDGRVVSNFINQAINQQDITIYGTGDQTRSFCYVDDTVDALIRLMNQNETNGPINIGNPYEMTMNELAQKILTLMPYSSSKIIYEQLPNDDPRQRKPDISKAKEYLDWTPSTKLEDGLNKTIKYFLDIY